MNGGPMTPTKPLSCPYQDGECPHIQELRGDMKEETNRFDAKLDKIERMLYIAIGIISVTCGVAMW